MKTKTCYIDATDFTYHADNEPVTLFPSIESIREEKSCVGGCGVLKVTLVETERVATGSRDGEFSCRDIEQLSPEYRAHLRNEIELRRQQITRLENRNAEDEKLLRSV